MKIGVSLLYSRHVFLGTTIRFLSLLLTDGEAVVSACNRIGWFGRIPNTTKLRLRRIVWSHLSCIGQRLSNLFLAFACGPFFAKGSLWHSPMASLFVDPVLRIPRFLVGPRLTEALCTTPASLTHIRNCSFWVSVLTYCGCTAVGLALGFHAKRVWQSSQK